MRRDRRPTTMWLISWSGSEIPSAGWRHSGVYRAWPSLDEFSFSEKRRKFYVNKSVLFDC